LLNDIWGQHVGPEHVREALASAEAGPVAEGAVGGGTGMICHEFKGGIGTASRRLSAEQGGWTVGVLVQANHGKRQELRVDGYPVGRQLMDISSPFADRGTPGMGSIVVIIATDAPLLPHQCQRLAQRASIGIARTGGGTEDSSGDLFLAFATGNQDLPVADYGRKGLPLSTSLQMVNNDHISPLFSAAAEAVEEAIINAIVAGEDMLTDDGIRVPGLDSQTLLQALRQTGWRDR
jgi:D-aminopeptidase